MWPNYSQVMNVPPSTISWWLLRTVAVFRRHKMLLVPWLRKGRLLVHNKSTVICGFIFVCRVLFWACLFSTLSYHLRLWTGNLGLNLACNIGKALNLFILKMVSFS